jgi:putative PEP-CTERM system histidine kinase
LLRSISWLGFLLAVLSQTWKNGASNLVRWGFPWIIGVFSALVLTMEIARLGVGQAVVPGTNFDLAIFSRLVITVFGLLLVENLFSYTDRNHRWAIKYLCLGIGALFGYDFFLYSDALLFQRVNGNLLDVRGMTNALIVPLIAVSARRNRDWSLDIFVSRQVIFHTATLIAAGSYLLVMAGTGYYLRQFGGDWGSAVQALFLFGALVLLFVVFFSGSVRARIKVFITKHFYANKFDYREEWQRVIDMISSLETQGSLPERVIKAIAEIVDSANGALWLRHDANRFTLEASWNRPADTDPDPTDPSFVKFLEDRKWVISFDEFAATPEKYGELNPPQWLEKADGAWLVVPLMHHAKLIGILLLGQPRSARSLNWEDYDLLKTVGRQAASYLAEQQTARALAETQQFDQFNRRFAFVIHDIKNLVSQLSLMIDNARKHKDNPQFQQDMLDTVRESVEKMKRLMTRLHESGREAASIKLIDLEDFMRRATGGVTVPGGALEFESRAGQLAVVADEERLAAVMAHVIANAVDAAVATVKVVLRSDGAQAIIEVSDDGAGMTPEFLRDELFRPFASTKDDGYGIGAYESREYVRELGGVLEVNSEVGSGTLVRIVLPAVGVAVPSSESEQRMSSL